MPKSLEIYCTFVIIFSASGDFVLRLPTGTPSLDPLWDSRSPKPQLCKLAFQYSERIDAYDTIQYSINSSRPSSIVTQSENVWPCIGYAKSHDTIKLFWTRNAHFHDIGWKKLRIFKTSDAYRYAFSSWVHA